MGKKVSRIFLDPAVMLLYIIVATLGLKAVFHISVAIHPMFIEGVYPESVEGHSCTVFSLRSETQKVFNVLNGSINSPSLCKKMF